MTGAPNAGKSSLMNRLANQPVAIVTDVPGTTRDVIRQSIAIEGVAIQLSDTAGIRAATDAIEQEGIERAQAALDTADIIIDVIDDREPKDAEFSSNDTAQSVIRVLNKIDLSGRTPRSVEHSRTGKRNTLADRCSFGGDWRRYSRPRTNDHSLSGYRRG